MEVVFIHLMKSSALIAAFLLAYYFLLRKETFFKSNRWFLLFGLVTSVLLPLVTFKKVVFVEAAPKMDWVNVPVSTIAAPPAETFEINWLIVAAGIYAIGVLVLLLRFAIDFRSLSKVLSGKKVQQQADFKFIDVVENVAPFSYFNYIVYNSGLYSEAELANVLEHEKVHCDQNHTADVLITRLFCIVFWYNPFVWLYQKAVLQNLEFIADAEALKNISDKTAYQITLLKVTTHEHCVAISNHFFQSLIKKRIVMLNKNQSTKWNSWKYLLIVPALAAFMFYFQVKVIAQEKPMAVAELTAKEPITLVIDKNSTDAELKEKTAAAKENGIALKFSKVKRNAAGEIVSIKAEYKEKSTDKKGVYQVSGDEPIKTLRFFKRNNGAIGFSNSGSLQIFKNREAVADADLEAPETPDVPEDVESPEAPEPPEPPIFHNSDVSVHTGTNGKMTVSVNGESINVDMDKIFADVNLALADLGDLGDINVDIDSKELRKITREALREAREEIRKARPEMHRARMELIKSRPEIERAKREIERSKPELEQAKREIEQAREEIKQAKIEIEQQRAEIEKSKAASKK